MSEKKPMGRSNDGSSEESLVGAPSHDDIARLAYELWEARGAGDGSAEQDWLEAERRLQEPRVKMAAA